MSFYFFLHSIVCFRLISFTCLFFLKHYDFNKYRRAFFLSVPHEREREVWRSDPSHSFVPYRFYFVFSSSSSSLFIHHPFACSTDKRLFISFTADTFFIVAVQLACGECAFIHLFIHLSIFYEQFIAPVHYPPGPGWRLRPINGAGSFIRSGSSLDELILLLVCLFTYLFFYSFGHLFLRN